MNMGKFLCPGPSISLVTKHVVTCLTKDWMSPGTKKHDYVTSHLSGAQLTFMMGELTRQVLVTNREVEVQSFFGSQLPLNFVRQLTKED
jgi:hypothetical protein